MLGQARNGGGRGRARVALLAGAGLVVLAGGCGGSSTIGSDGGTDGGTSGGKDLAVAKACTGSLAGAVSGSFASCALSFTLAGTEQDLNLVVNGWSGDAIQTALFGLVAPSGFAVRSYGLDALVGTSLLVQNKLSEKYTASNDGSGALQGTVTLVVTSPPQPPQGATEWTDKAMHGTLDATLPLDPNSPGQPGSKVTAHFAF